MTYQLFECHWSLVMQCLQTHTCVQYTCLYLLFELGEMRLIYYVVLCK